MASSYTTQIKDLSIISKSEYYFLTSSIYPLEILENLNISTSEITGRSNTSSDLGVYNFNQDLLKSGINNLTGTLKVALKVYQAFSNTSDTDKTITSVYSVTGVLREVLKQYAIKEDTFITSISNISGTFTSALIAYNFYKAETMINSVSNISGSSSSLQKTFEVFIKGR